MNGTVFHSKLNGQGWPKAGAVVAAVGKQLGVEISPEEQLELNEANKSGCTIL
eukprot:CAMPEP_0175097386 /NCGR_PEP_ID=MMETSP0086_2-20121207/5258_1 /TAXON_ID=136419 /ORGANISM="Unknown Unknown, Strain D1" /LENGTH=52 /DNA_ID=CAMNT_0016370891 /DNA_START=196 /DNA_END=354 /DNA_ORIENTATION=-